MRNENQEAKSQAYGPKWCECKLAFLSPAVGAMWGEMEGHLVPRLGWLFSRKVQGAVIFAAAALAALRAMRRIALVRWLACCSVRGKSGIGGSGGNSARGAGCGGVVVGVNAGCGAGHGGCMFDG